MTFNDKTFEVQIEAGINFEANEVFAIFQSIDPVSPAPATLGRASSIQSQSAVDAPSRRDLSLLTHAIATTANASTTRKITAAVIIASLPIRGVKTKKPRWISCHPAAQRRSGVAGHPAWHTHCMQIRPDGALFA